jgi:hypothetical protein
MDFAKPLKVIYDSDIPWYYFPRRMMSTYRRPWWLVVNRSSRPITTVHEEAHRGERIFIVQGEPVVQGLSWLIWGPLGALVVIAILTWLAIALNVKAQGGAIRVFFIFAFFVLPAVAWGLLSLVFARLSQKHIQAERQAGARECIIRLHQKQGEFLYQTSRDSPAQKVSFEHIRRIRVAPPIGRRDAKALRLLLETDEETVILIDETWGTPTQKTDLAHELQQAVESYATNFGHG